MGSSKEGQVTIVDPRAGTVGEWLFAPSAEVIPDSRPLAAGLVTLTDLVLPVFEAAQLFAVRGVAIRPIGGPDDGFPSLAEAGRAVDAKESALPTSEASIEVACAVELVEGEARHTIEEAAAICWRWIGEGVIQVKIYCDAFLPRRLDGGPNPLAAQNAPRLAAALTELQRVLHATVELGDDEMPWTTAHGFLLANK